MKLSVLIPSMEERRELLARLLWNLVPQPGVNNDFEILVNRREGPLGGKVNELVEAASGTHIVIVGDDDWLPGYYMSYVLPRLDRDVCGYRIAVLVNGKYSMSMRHSPEFEGWGAMDRCYAPQIPVRKSLVEDLSFGDEYAADKTWSLEVEPRIGDFHYVDYDLYVYDHWTKRDTEWARSRDVGKWRFDNWHVKWL